MNRLIDFFSKKLNLKIPLWCLLLLPFMAYAAWEYYWYTKVGLRVIKWHTHLVQYAYVWLAGVFIFQLFWRRKNAAIAGNYFLIFTSIVFSLGIMEAFLQLTGTYNTYLEKVSGFYDSPYTSQDKGHYHGWIPNQPHWIIKPEYKFWRPTNSLGLADREWEVQKKKNEKRLLTLGDSFTEGDGAPYDSAYPALLNKKLLAGGDTFYLMNAGICGSDPFNNYIFLKNKLLVYQPDIVLQALGSFDLMSDILLRGGMERFLQNGTQQFRPAPWWEPMYAVSYISRIFFSLAGYDELLRKEGLRPGEQEWLNKTVSDLFIEYAALCKQKGIRLFVILRPDRLEIERRQYIYDFSNILRQLQSTEAVVVIDLLPLYVAYIEKNKTTEADYFWKYDGHHNAIGYEMMAESVYESLAPHLRDSITGHLRSQ